MSNYLERLIDIRITEAMKYVGCIVIEGPKWCGKSTTSKRFAKTVVELQNPNKCKTYMMYADMGDKALLDGAKPLMFDEWQKIPDLWDYIRAEIDETRGKGSFILTGSAKPIENSGRHSGIGRIKRIVMRPMSLWESKESNGTISVGDLFKNGYSCGSRDSKSLKDIAYILCRGGWPQAIVETDKSIALNAAKDYVSSLVETDITDIDGIKRNAARARAILRSYARNVSASAKIQTLQKDLEANYVACDLRTIESYINAFKKLFVIDDVEAWSPRLRSKAMLRTADTRQFVDPSIVATLLDANAEDLMSDLNTFGLLFESMCVRDLRIYADSIDGKVFNFRDSRGLEIDTIIHLNNGKWAAIEIKLGGEEAIEGGVKNLLKLQEVVDTEKMKAPSFLMVLVATGFAHQRPDGVLVVPIGCLKN